MIKIFRFDSRIEEMSKKALESAKENFAYIDEITEYNQQKMLRAFIDKGVTESMFAESTGYGYNDRGREIIDEVFAQAVGAEDSIVRHNFTCGTHTLAVALFGVLRPGDTMLCVTGTPDLTTLFSLLSELLKTVIWVRLRILVSSMMKCLSKTIDSTMMP